MPESLKWLLDIKVSSLVVLLAGTTGGHANVMNNLSPTAAVSTRAGEPRCYMDAARSLCGP